MKNLLEGIELLRQANKNGITQAKDWKEYSDEVADNYGIPHDAAWFIFVNLGPSEAFDGFISEVEDYVQMGGF